jgi:hypothetical protein
MNTSQDIIWNLFLVGFLFIPIALGYVSLLALMGV